MTGKVRLVYLSISLIAVFAGAYGISSAQSATEPQAANDAPYYIVRQRQQWEYANGAAFSMNGKYTWVSKQTQNQQNLDLLAGLNEMGKQGWELVTFIPDRNNALSEGTYIFKRPAAK